MDHILNERTNERTNGSASVPPCSHVGCVALAAPGGLCALHAAGYRQCGPVVEGKERQRCWRCRRVLREGDWFRQVDGKSQHVQSCALHPEVEKAERATA